MGLFAFILTYILGGLTLLPILLCLILLHAHLTFPQHPSALSFHSSGSDQIRDPNDDGQNLKSEKAIANLSEKFQRGHEPDVAAGYFAVCREYVPGGVNGKPPERTTPAGEVITMESPSVYQSMYRSLFLDRRQVPSLDPVKGAGRAVKRARNTFFVVLRHGHLMLYDDSEQLEVRHVISLAHHHISIYGGEEEEILEGDLWIKRNAICLTRKPMANDEISSPKPFFLFSDNCSDKEDFYFALLQNQEVKPQGPDNPPRPQQFDIKHIIGLVQKLHSSEEHLQSRWINAFVGRGFLALYKTQEIEDFVRKKISRKIARVKKPAFLSSIILENIDMGGSAPYITNPRLKDLTVDGECCVEADVTYNGKFRLELAATARIDLGARFKAREVNLMLAVVCKSLEGHCLVRFKPPPSNRIWIAFEAMPSMELSIEPIVSSRQITYNIILRAIESRIREVVAETLVLPHWDDSPFTDSQHQEYRGGIWARNEEAPNTPTETGVTVEVSDGEGEKDIAATLPSPSPRRSKNDAMMSATGSSDRVHPNLTSLKATDSPRTPIEDVNSLASTGAEKGERPPKAMRSRSFASAADPLVSLDNINVDSTKHEKKNVLFQDATRAMLALSNRSQPTSQNGTPVGSPPGHATLWQTSRADSSSSTSSKPTSINEQSEAPAGFDGSNQAALPATPSRKSSHSVSSMNANTSSHEAFVQPNAQGQISGEKRQSISALGTATAAAKKWGWNVLSRNYEGKNPGDELVEAGKVGTPQHPIGRGRPLPPPGQPLPFPERPGSKALSGNMAKRKPLPTPPLSLRRQDGAKSGLVPVSPLLAQINQQNGSKSGSSEEHLMVVKAPFDVEPAISAGEPHPDSGGASGPEPADLMSFTIPGPKKTSQKTEVVSEKTERSSPRQFSSSYEDDDSPLSSWQSAQEEVSRSKSMWMENNEHS